MKKVIVPSALAFMLIAGQAHAQLAGGDTTSDISNRNVSGAIPTAPGNPNTSTVVPDTGNTTNDSYSSLPDTENFNTITPSSGGNNTTLGAPGNAFAAAPADMSLSQFTTYIRGRWGINENQTITQSEWNGVDPAFFSDNKPSFGALDSNHNGNLSSDELQPVYSRLYQEYQIRPKSPPAPEQQP